MNKETGKVSIMDNEQITNERENDSVKLSNDSLIKKIYEFIHINFNIIGKGLLALYLVFKFLYIDNAEKFYNIPAEFFITEINLKYIIPFAAVGVCFISLLIITLEKEKYISKEVYIIQNIVTIFFICFLSYMYMAKVAMQILKKVVPLIIAIPLVIVILFIIFIILTVKSLKNDKNNYIKMDTCSKDFIIVWNLDIENINSKKVISKFENYLSNIKDDQNESKSIFEELKNESQNNDISKKFIEIQLKKINDIYINIIKNFLEKLEQDNLISKENFNEMHYKIFEQNKMIEETISNKKKEKLECSCNESIARKIKDQIVSYQKNMLKKYYDIIRNDILIPAKTKALFWAVKLLMYIVFLY